MYKEGVERNCVICGKMFISFHPQSITCSNECRRKRNAQMKREWNFKRLKSVDMNKYRSDSLNNAVKEQNEFNRKHGTHLTYGKYIAMKDMGVKY